MADYGAKISKPGYDVKTALSSTNKKNFTILSTDDALLVSSQGVISASTNIAHGLGFAPLWDAYAIVSSTELIPAGHGESGDWLIEADSTYLYCTKVGTYSLFYIIYLNQP